MDNIYTIGFTKKSAEKFFGLLNENHVEVILDVRLNNTSQLAGFSKYPDIKFFLSNICGIEYISDTQFAPEEWILKDYKGKKITWAQYVMFFDELMEKRNIMDYIKSNYARLENKRVCLLCSEEKSDNCHRSLIAQRFKELYDAKIINL
jgi:uncharacterized protein (DUF488 family)